MTPLLSCISAGPISVGSNVPSPPPSIMAGPAMPIQESRVAILKSAHPNRAAFPAKQKPLFIAIRGTLPANLAQLVNERTLSPAMCVVTSVSPGLPPPPSVYMITGRANRSAKSHILSNFLW